MNKKIYVFMVFAALFWAGAFIAGKFTTPYIPTFTLTFLRFSIAAVILFFIMKRENKKSGDMSYSFKKKDLPLFIFTGVVGMAGYHVLFFMALKHTGAINASIIAAMNPIITTLLMAIFFATIIPRKQLVGILISFAGAVLTITGGSVSTLLEWGINKGDVMMVVAMCCWAAYSVVSKTKGKGVSPLALTYYSILVCSIGLIPMVIIESPWREIAEADFTIWAAIIYMAVFPSVLGFLTQQIAIKEIGPSRTNIFINLVPVFSTILAVTILNEKLSTTLFITGGIIVLGVVITQSCGEKNSGKKKSLR